MYGDFKNKKLLILGAYLAEIEIIKVAKEIGCFTIVTDSHINWSDAPAKYEADEAWDISWTDYDSLYKKCLEEGIDGVMAGFSEKRVYAATKLSEMLNKPFYAKGAYLDLLLNKDEFKKICMQSNIRIPKNYSIDDKIDFPVIIKPVDNGGSRGISICYNEEEFLAGYNKALDASDSKKVLIEEYLSGDEIMVYFTVHDGEIELSAMCDRIMYKNAKNDIQLPVGYYYPSRYLEIFKKYNFDKFKNMIKRFNINNGLIAFQSFCIGNDVIPFDPTYRLDGTMAYHLTEYNNSINALKMLINYSLTGSMGDFDNIKSKENPVFSKYTFEMPILLTKGKIASIEGIDLVRNEQGVIFVEQKKFVGDILKENADFSQMLCRIHICCDSLEELKNIVKNINSFVKVKNSNGDSLILYNFDIDLLNKYK